MLHSEPEGPPSASAASKHSAFSNVQRDPCHVAVSTNTSATPPHVHAAPPSLTPCRPPNAPAELLCACRGLRLKWQAVAPKHPTNWYAPSASSEPQSTKFLVNILQHNSTATSPRHASARNQPVPLPVNRLPLAIFITRPPERQQVQPVKTAAGSSGRPAPLSCFISTW